MRRLMAMLLAVMAAAWCVPASAACLERPITDPQVVTAAKGAERSFRIVAPDSDAAEFEAKGYHPATCEKMDAAAYRDGICMAVKMGDSVVRNRLAEVFGARPEKLCAAARVATGLPAEPKEDKSPPPPVVDPAKGPPKTAAESMPALAK